MELTTPYCTFLLDGLLFGVDVACVREVMRQQQLTEIPLAPGVVSGLIHQRGQILTAIDLRRRLGLPPRNGNAGFRNVVVQASGRLISFLVDEIADVIQVNPDSAEPPPETLGAAHRELIRCVFKLDKQLLLVLDAERTLASLEPASRALTRQGLSGGAV